MTSKQKFADRPVMSQKLGEDISESKEGNPSNFQALGQLRARSRQINKHSKLPSQSINNIFY